MEDAPLQEVQRIQSHMLKSEYEGKLSNQFMDELKYSTLFQADWSELISAAPTALSMMGSFWVAAADPMAEKISLAKCMPTGGFQYLTKRDEPTLRSCLVDVCNNGGRTAFTKAGANMAALQINSRRICEERITMVFRRLGPCTNGEDELEDFRDALEALNKDAKRCAALATDTREVFTRWGLMVGELNACTEVESGRASIQKDAMEIDEEMMNVRVKFELDKRKVVEEEIKGAALALKRAEDRLDKALGDVPGPVMNLVTSVVTGFVSAIPIIISSPIPVVMSAVGSMVGDFRPDAAVPGVAGAAPGSEATPPPAVLKDPSYTAAIEIRELVNQFYEYLGGDTGTLDKPKSVELELPRTQGTPQRISYLLGNLEEHKAHLDVNSTVANRKMHNVFNTLIKVGKEIQAHLRDSNGANGMSDGTLPVKTLENWRKSVKKAQQDVLQLVVAGSTASSTSVPHIFARIGLEPADKSTRSARLSTAMQAVQLTQSAADAKQDAYDAALAKQAKTAAMMVEVQQKLKRLQKEGRTIDEIKSVLSSCISVLTDLTVQIGKIEQFFTMLSTIIDNIVMVRAADFTREMDKAGRRAKVNGCLRVDDLSKQTIYTATLQLKGYFSLLQDISFMYTQVDQPYVRDGLDLCSEISKGAAHGKSTTEMQKRLTEYIETSGAAVARILKESQDEIKRGLHKRIAQATETAHEIETVISSHGLAVDQGAKQAIEAGAKRAKEDAKRQIEATMGPCETLSSENTDANDW